VSVECQYSGSIVQVQCHCGVSVGLWLSAHVFVCMCMTSPRSCIYGEIFARGLTPSTLSPAKRVVQECHRSVTRVLSPANIA
jgi:hypothetical protein